MKRNAGRRTNRCLIAAAREYSNKPRCANDGDSFQRCLRLMALPVAKSVPSRFHSSVVTSLFLSPTSLECFSTIDVREASLATLAPLQDAQIPAKRNASQRNAIDRFEMLHHHFSHCSHSPREIHS